MTLTMQVQAQQTIAENVYNHTLSLIESLKDNYRDYAIRGHRHSVYNANPEDLHSIQYHSTRIQDLTRGILPIDYVIESGKKYHKVIFIDGGGQHSVHAFVDKKTGELYKPSSWKSPAKGVRYNLLIIKEREWLFANADWSGGYLYAR